MAKTRASQIAAIVREHEQEILSDWTARQKQSVSSRPDLINDAELQRQSREFLNAFVAGANGSIDDVHAPGWRPALELLSRISESRAVKGFSPRETAMFVFSLKQPLFAQLRKSVADVDALADETWTATLLLDSLGLHTTEMFQKSREGVITRQQ